jgi:hypothetical protein
LLLELPEDGPDFATPSFAAWVGEARNAPWQIASDAPGALWLVDTRDAQARRAPRLWPDSAERDSFGAALILSGSGRPGSRFRRVLRRIRRPGTARMSEKRTAALLLDPPVAPFIRRLAFEDGPEVPTTFKLLDGSGNGGGSTGTAFLLTQKPPFVGPVWSFIAARLNERELNASSLQLRARGAGIVMMQGSVQGYVVRLVPAGAFQAVVARNHSSLQHLRSILRKPALLERMPAPLLAEMHGSALVLAETRLDGTLAWTLASGVLAPIIRRDALDFLETLRDATSRTIHLEPEGTADLLREDRQLVTASDFVRARVKRLIDAEFSRAVGALAGRDLVACTSHGDFGYGNILVDPQSGALQGVIDWDTAREVDFPGIDRVNLEIQIRRGLGDSFAEAVRAVWNRRLAQDALITTGGPDAERALFGLGVCRLVIRSMRYPVIYGLEAADYERALAWLAPLEPRSV